MLTITDGVVTEIASFQKHRCDPAKIEAWELYVDERTRASEQYAQDLADVTEAALKKDCLKCGALRGHPCENLTARRQGNFSPTVWPHEARRS